MDQHPKKPAKPASPGLFVILALGLFFLLPTVLSGLPTRNSSSETSKKSKEREAIEFCKLVRESVKPGDKLCGKYLAAVDAEIAKDKKEDAAKEAQKKAAAEAAARTAADPWREISSMELTTCRTVLKQAMKDPDSFKVNNETRAGGGMIDYTATNGFGGPVRKTFQCTTWSHINE